MARHLRPVVNTDPTPSKKWPKARFTLFGGPYHGQKITNVPPFDETLTFGGETYHLIVEQNLYVHDSRRPT